MINEEEKFICEICGNAEDIAFDICPKCKKPSRLSPFFPYENTTEDGQFQCLDCKYTQPNAFLICPSCKQPTPLNEDYSMHF